MYQKADALAHVIYDAVRSFPRDELFGLTAQLKRAAVSVSALGRPSRNRGRTRWGRSLGKGP